MVRDADSPKETPPQPSFRGRFFIIAPGTGTGNPLLGGEYGGCAAKNLPLKGASPPPLEGAGGRFA